MIEEHFVSTGV